MGGTNLHALCLISYIPVKSEEYMFFIIFVCVKSAQFFVSRAYIYASTCRLFSNFAFNTINGLDVHFEVTVLSPTFYNHIAHR